MPVKHLRESNAETNGLMEAFEREYAESGARAPQERTLTKLRLYIQQLKAGESVENAARKSAVTYQTVNGWRRRSDTFHEWMTTQVAANEVARKVAAEVRRKKVREERRVLIERDRGVPDRGGLADFRWKYFGRPTLAHQELAVEALEDYTNLYVFIYGPPGMGKDTLAGDYCAWEAAPDRSGKTVAWFMESSDFSQRRFGRLGQYLVDPKAYDRPPSKTPGGQTPTASLITDFGPFKWSPEMEWPDGTKVAKKPWTAHSKYFVQVDAPEQDPNLWATGIGGSTYGSRIKVCVCSDIFTLENQRSPTERVGSYEWVTGTLDTRLDDDGRLVVLGTMLDIENNYERMEEDYTAGARVVYQKEHESGVLTKYSNGVCIVRIAAIWVGEDGEERSFWPDMFPLDDILVSNKGTVYPVEAQTDDDLKELMARPTMRLRRGLKGRRQRSPDMFEANYNQRRNRSKGGDFTDDVFETAKDDERSFGQVYAHELRVVGVDPARRYGAGWLLWAVDRRSHTLTIADFFFGTELGYDGIKQQLVIAPITKWTPIWYCYEDNKEGAILADSMIQEFIDASGTSVFTDPTGSSRNDPNVGPAILSSYMRVGQIRIPYKTAADRAKFEVVKAQFKAWDRGTANTRRTKPGQPGHQPDELCMAAWVGSKKAIPLLEARTKDQGISMRMPAGIRRKFNRAMADVSSRRAERVADMRTGSARAPGVSAAQALDEMMRDQTQQNPH